MKHSFSFGVLALVNFVWGNAYAQDSGGADVVKKTAFDFMQFLPLILIFGIFYFLLIRPQQKKMKQHKEMLNHIRRGDRVVTAGGLLGVIAKIENDEQLQVDLGHDMVVTVLRSSISQVLNKSDPVPHKTSSGGESQDPKLKASSSSKVRALRKPTKKNQKDSS